jgi:hypothetical protein
LATFRRGFARSRVWASFAKLLFCVFDRGEPLEIVRNGVEGAHNPLYVKLVGLGSTKNIVRLEPENISNCRRINSPTKGLRKVLEKILLVTRVVRRRLRQKEHVDTTFANTYDAPPQLFISSKTLLWIIAVNRKTVSETSLQHAGRCAMLPVPIFADLGRIELSDLVPMLANHEWF